MISQLTFVMLCHMRTALPPPSIGIAAAALVRVRFGISTEAPHHNNTLLVQRREGIAPANLPILLQEENIGNFLVIGAFVSVNHCPKTLQVFLDKLGLAHAGVFNNECPSLGIKNMELAISLDIKVLFGNNSDTGGFLARGGTRYDARDLLGGEGRCCN